MGFSVVSAVKNPLTKQEFDKFDLWFGKIPWRRKWQPTPVFLPGKSHGQRSLVGFSPWGRKRVGHNLMNKPQHACMPKIPCSLASVNGSEGSSMQNKSVTRLDPSQHPLFPGSGFHISSVLLFCSNFGTDQLSVSHICWWKFLAVSIWMLRFMC